MTEPVKIGIIGCGNISGIYLKNLSAFAYTDVVACADLIPERAEARAREFGGIRACSVDSLLADPQIEIVVNLTTPASHAQVDLRALAQGKHVYGEKPLAVKRADGQKIVDVARSCQLRVGCGPDTFFGGALQTARKLVDDGWIGEPIGAMAFMTSHGPEDWRPDPEFLYQVGGGPMFDMGPYYLTALVSLLGPVRRVTGSARTTFPERTITSQPRYGARIKVDVPAHVAGVLDFASGAVGMILTSFDVWGAALPDIEIYGTRGSLSVPDPNNYGGSPRVFYPRAREWSPAPLTHGYLENSRGVGVADMACALRSGRPHRASGEMALHVLDIMHALHEASSEGRHIELATTRTRPDPLPLGLADFELDE